MLQKNTFSWLIFAISLFCLPSVLQAQIWSNEIHYQNAGTDANEKIELAGLAGTSLTGWKVVLYEGSDGSVYATINLSGSLSAANCTVNSQGIGLYVIDVKAVTGFSLGNGGLGLPDGWALVNGTTVVELNSYGGIFTATAGAATGMVSVDIGTVETSTCSDASSIQRTGATTWVFADGTNTFNGLVGACNTIQYNPNAPQPPASNAGPNQEIALGATATLAAIATNGTGAWSVFSGPSTSSAQFSSTTANNAVFTPAGGVGTYVLRWTVTSGMASATDDVNIVVDPLPPAANLQIWSNEIHYQNNGVDINEKIEVAGPAGTNLAGWKILFYEGTTGTVYATALLSGTLPNTCTVGGQNIGVAVVDVVTATGGSAFGNGPGDGWALVFGATPVEFLSYGGSFTATNGFATGLTSVDINAVEPNTTAATSSIQRTGTVTWVFAEGTNTFGACNSTQYNPNGPQPPVANAGPDREISVVGAATMAAIATNGTGAWSVVSGPSTSNAQFSSTTAANAVFTPASGAGTYTLRWTVSANSFPNAIDDANVIVYALPPSECDQIFSNEIHYQNNGPDINERIEVAGPAGTSLNGWKIQFYEGSNGTVYATANLSGTLPNTCTVSGINTGVSVVDVAAATGFSLGNGPDGWALVFGATPVEFFSYGGAFTATNGFAAGMTSVNIGATESGTTSANSSIQRSGAATWVFAEATNTFSACNTNQYFCPKPVANAGPNQLLCGGSSATLAATAFNGTGAWSIVNGPSTSLSQFSSTSAATAVFTPAGGAGTYTLRWTVSAGGYPSAVDDVDLQFSPIPNAAITGELVICPGGNRVLTATGGGTYAWSTLATTAAITVNTAGTYTVTVTNAGCTKTATATTSILTAGTISAIPNIPAINSSLGVCFGSTITLSSNGTPGGTWVALPKPINQQVVSVTPSGGVVTPLIATNSTDTNTVFYRVMATGCLASTNIQVEVLGLDPGTINGNTTFCAGTTSALTVNGVGGGTWSSDNMSVATVNPSSGLVTGASGGTAKITYTVTSGGCDNSTSVVVTIKPAPLTTITPNPSPVCANSTLNLSVPNAGVGATYNWSGNGITNANSNATSAIPTGSGLQAYSVTVTGSNGCTATGSVNVTVNAQPDATITPTPNPVCLNAPLTLAVPSAGVGASYNWAGNGVTNNNTNSTDATPNAAGPQVYNVTVTASTGCSKIGTVSVTVNPLPPTPVIAGGGTYCGSAVVSLSTAAASSYQWQYTLFPDPNGPIFTPIGNTNPINVSQTGVYVVTVTNAFGCSAVSASTVVNVADYVFSGSLGAGDAQQTGRLNRFNAPATCAAPKVCPGINSPTGARFYDSYTLTNTSAAPVCATIGVNSTCNSNIFSVAYAGSFNPASLCTNYLADPGSSPFNFVGYEATVPAGGTIVVVVHETNSGIGCGAYTLSVDLPGSLSGVTVTPNPNPVCQNGTLNLSTAVVPGATYSWAGNGVVASSTNTTTAVPTVSGPQTYTVTVTLGSGCTSKSASTSVTVNPIIGCPNTYNPANSQTNVGLNIGTLDWNDVLGATSYLVSFGTNAPNYNNILNNVSVAVSNATIGAMSPNQTYGYKVVPVGFCGSPTGCQTVTFSTCIPTFTCPANRNVNLNANCALIVPDLITGLAADPGCGTLSFMQNPTVGTIIPSSHNGTVLVTITPNNPAVSSCTVTLTGKDVTPPTITCPGNQTAVPAVAATCNAVINGINATTGDNCGATLSYALTGATTASGNGQASGLTFNSGVTTVTYTVTDAGGNMTNCSFTVRVAPCVNGRIIWKQDNTTGVKDVTVAVTGDQTTSALTGLDGKYGFIFPTGSNFTITPSKNINKLNGVNAQDVFRFQQHLSGNFITDPWQLIAMDVSNDNTINSLDLSIIQQSIMGNPQALALFLKSWRFVPTSHTLTNPPWGFPERIVLTGASGNQVNKDFYGVKMGDIVAIYANPANLGAEPPFVLTAPDKFLQAGDDIAIDFRADEIADLAAFQFGLHFDTQRLDLQEIQSLTALPLTNDNFGLYEKAEGNIKVLWAGTEGTDVPEAAPVFRLTFKVLTSGGKLSDALQLNEAVLSPRAYKSNLAESNVLLNFLGVSGTNNPGALQDRLVLYQNQPNPFATHTSIGFELPQACVAQLRIFDAAGRVIEMRNKQYTAGVHNEAFDLDGVAGVLYYELTTPFGVLTKKMVVVK